MKPALRRALGPAYPLLMQLKSAPLVYWTKLYLGYWPYRRARQADPGRLVIDVASPIGMGAVLAYLLRLHAYAEDQGLDGRFISTSPLYGASDGKDFLADHFERPALPSGARPLSRLASEWALHRAIPATMPLARASALFDRYFRPNAALLRRVAEAAGGIERFDLSIHFRGTDKFLETGRVDIAGMLDALAPHLLDGGSGKRVFLASDDAEFREILAERFPRAHYVSFDIGEVEPGMPRHFSDLSPHDKATEALVNVLLLGRAPLCVRTMSYLSSLARVASPGMRTQTINWTSTGALPFPEDELWRSEQLEAAGLTRVSVRTPSASECHE